MKSNTTNHGEIEAILNSRKTKQNTNEYLVKWKNEDEAIWQSLISLSKYMKYILQFQKSRKPKRKKSLDNIQSQEDDIKQICKKFQNKNDKIINQTQTNNKIKKKRNRKRKNQVHQIQSVAMKTRLRSPDIQIIDSQEFDNPAKVIKKQIPHKIICKQPLQSFTQNLQVEYIQYVGQKNKEHIYMIKYINGPLLKNQKSSQMRKKHPMELIQYLQASFLDEQL